MEQLLVQEIIRYGEYVIFKEGEEIDHVADFIGKNLREDNLHFHDTLFQRILTESEEHLSDENWQALPFFLNHPNEQISTIAAKLSTEKDELCTNNKLQYGNDEDHLQERIPQLLNDYKMALVEAQLETLRRQLAEAYQNGDLSKVVELMQQIRDLNELHKYVGEATSRIITLK